MDNITLNNGVVMPAVGFGVFRVGEGEACANAVSEAIDVGYRLLDTAQGYWNEASVGEGIRLSGIDREKLFLTTKVWMSEYGEERAYRSVLASMERLGTDYLDLILLHQPVGDYYGAYRALIRLYREQRVRAIGVSNFSASQIADLCLFQEIAPAVNQIAINPFQQAVEAEAVHRKYKVKLEAYAPLGNANPNLLNNHALEAIAGAKHKSVAQVILRWLNQRGIASVSKSTHRDRMESNLRLLDFELSEDEMRTIAALDRTEPDAPEARRVQIVEALRSVVDRESCHVLS